jgi:hypothetical protein
MHTAEEFYTDNLVIIQFSDTVTVTMPCLDCCYGNSSHRTTLERCIPFWMTCIFQVLKKKCKLNSAAERPSLVGEVSANFLRI